MNWRKIGNWAKRQQCTIDDINRVIYDVHWCTHSSFALKRDRAFVVFLWSSAVLALINTRAFECNFSHSIPCNSFPYKLKIENKKKQKKIYLKKNSTKSFMDCDWTHQLCHPNQVCFVSLHSSYTCFVSHFTRFKETSSTWMKSACWFSCWWWFLFWQHKC